MAPFLVEGGPSQWMRAGRPPSSCCLHTSASACADGTAEQEGRPWSASRIGLAWAPDRRLLRPG